MTNRNVARAVRVTLVTAGAMSAGLYGAASAAQEQLEEIVVTGSRIARALDDQILPVAIISRESIDASGENSVSEILRNSSFNSFGSFDAQSGSSGGAQGSAIVNLRGLGSARSLVLIDGRRASYAPAFGAAAVNLNAIPLAGVERIEILRDGASAVYGSDAIGGVLNIITRKDFEGVSIEAGATFPQEDGGEEASASIILGLNGERGNMTFSAEHYERAIVNAADRPWTAVGTSTLGGPGSFQRRGAPAGQTAWQADARCPANQGDSDQFPLSFILPSGANQYCGYNYAAIAAETAKVERDAAQLRADYEIVSGLEAFGRFQFSRNESFGRYAPAPAIFPNFVSATNPINPTIGEVDESTGYPLNLRYRFTSLGPRDTTVRDDVLEFLAGLRGKSGDIGALKNVMWEAAAGYNSYNQLDLGTGYGLISNFSAAVSACETEGIDSPNCYNPFADDGPDNNPQSFKTTISTDNQYTGKFADLRVNFALGSLPAGPVNWSWGAEYHDDTFKTQNDAQSDAGNVFGSAGGSASGGRTWWASYLETGVPLHETLEAQLAVRYDDYSDFGNATTGKAGLMWTPIDNLMFRASYGTGFRAPDLESLFGAASQSFEDSVDTLGCQLNPTDVFACETNQRETNFTSNPLLKAEESDQYSIGVGWRPLPSVNVTLDYYNIEIERSIQNLAAQQVLDFEADCFNTGTVCDPLTQGSVQRDPDTGETLLIVSPAVNQGFTKTDGIDLAATWSIDTASAGDFLLTGQLSQVLSFEEEVVPGQGLRDLLGYVSDALNSGQPELRANLGVNWRMSSIFAGVTAYYIDSFKACTAPPAGEPDSETGNGDCSRKIDSLTTFDIQAGYDFPWRGTVTIGGRNVTNEEPPLDAVFGNDQYSLALHGQGYFGAVWYVRYRQDF